MHTESQLKAMHKIKSYYRAALIDATCNLVDVPDYMKHYPRIMNYAIVIKDLSNWEDSGLLVNEHISSRHDTAGVLDMLNLLKYNYNKIFDEKKLFQIAMCDLSWSTIHGVLESLNGETVQAYSKRIFEMSKTKDFDQKNSLTIIGSCAAHTMKRFVRSLKKNVKFETKEIRVFSIFCFSLLLNCLDLSAFDSILRLMFLVFLNPISTQNCIAARKKLQELIEIRPKLDENVEKIINDEKNLSAFVNQQNIQDKEKEQLSEKDKMSDIEDFIDKKDTIKNSSPFTKHFSDLRIQNQLQIFAESKVEADDNVLFNECFINFLMDRFLPYSFIWSSFIFKNISPDDSITRRTNGAVERFFRERKECLNANLKPVNYINQTIKLALGQERIVSMNLSDAESSEELQEDDEQTIQSAVDKWKPKKNQRKSAKLPATGYQAPKKTLKNIDKKNTVEAKNKKPKSTKKSEKNQKNQSIEKTMPQLNSSDQETFSFVSLNKETANASHDFQQDSQITIAKVNQPQIIRVSRSDHLSFLNSLKEKQFVKIINIPEKK